MPDFNLKMLDRVRPEKFMVHTWYISRVSAGVIIRDHPTPGCRVVRTTLKADDFDNLKVFKDDQSIWNFAMAIGEKWEES